MRYAWIAGVLVGLVGLVALAIGWLGSPGAGEAPVDTFAGEAQRVTLRVDGMT
jgi:hypothetical protein